MENGYIKLPKLKTMIRIKQHRQFFGLIKSVTAYSQLYPFQFNYPGASRNIQARTKNVTHYSINKEKFSP